MKARIHLWNEGNGDQNQEIEEKWRTHLKKGRVPVVPMEKRVEIPDFKYYFFHKDPIKSRKNLNTMGKKSGLSFYFFFKGKKNTEKTVKSR